MNQIACPYCRGVISGQGIAPGQLLVCPHCGRQFVRPGGTPTAQAAAPAPARTSPAAPTAPMAAPAPARGPSAAAAAPRSAGGAQPEAEPSYGSQYAEQRQAQASMTIVWIVVSVVIGLMVLGLIGYLIFSNVGDRQRSKIEPLLYTEARHHVAANSTEVTEMLSIAPGASVNLEDDHVKFGRDSATVYLKVKGQKKYITIKFSLSGDEWSVDGPIEVTSGK